MTNLLSIVVIALTSVGKTEEQNFQPNERKPNEKSYISRQVDDRRRLQKNVAKYCFTVFVQITTGFVPC
jgi:hypothetical protein